MLENINVEYLQNDVEMEINIIKTSFMILCIYYTNFKITNTKIKINFELFYSSIIIIFTAFVCGLMKYRINYLINIMSSILIISIIFFKANIRNGLLTTIISFSINYVISFITIIISFIINIIMKFNNNSINLCIIIFLHIIILNLYLNIKKFKYGLSFLQKKSANEYIDILILNISVSIIFVTIIMVNSSINIMRDFLPALIMYSIFMCITIRKLLKIYYKHKLLTKEFEENKLELVTKKQEISQLEQEILNFSKKSHSLSHKQKSLEYKLNQLMQKSETAEEIELKSRLENISKELYKIATPTELIKTQITEIDDMLKFMQSECKENNIDFNLQILGNMHYMINNIITKEELEILMADHIKDAIIAIKHTDNINKTILVKLGQIEDNYGLYIYDSGIEFEEETLKNLGKKPSTTHADEGGTGMGFMNTFDTLRKYKASLIIEEIGKPSKEQYTKVIKIKFDTKNEFKVITYKQK